MPIRSAPRVTLAVTFALAALAGLLAWQLAAGAASGPGKPPGSMSLTITGADATCDTTASRCHAAPGSEFTVSVSLDALPEDGAGTPAGYAGLQTQLFYDGLIYKPAAIGDEILWPDSALTVRSPANPSGAERFVEHGGVTGTGPELPASSHVGEIVSITLTCTTEDATFDVALLPYVAAERPLGAAIRALAAGGELGETVPVPISGQRALELDSNSETPPELVDVADAWQIVCGEPPPPPDAPDLTVKSLRIELETGPSCAFTSQKLGVTVVVSNVGSADAGPFVVAVNGDAETVSPGLARGSSTTLWFNGFRVGQNTALVDAAFQVVELNEDNNARVEFPPVPTLPLPCTPTPDPNDRVGDVDCSGGVNAIDAALLLQLGAGLVSGLSCPANADVNRSGAVDAVDAALVLQFVAGLIGSLPV